MCSVQTVLQFIAFNIKGLISSDIWNIFFESLYSKLKFAEVNMA